MTYQKPTLARRFRIPPLPRECTRCEKNEFACQCGTWFWWRKQG